MAVLFYAVWLFIVSLIQTVPAQWIAVFDISPNIFILFVAAAAFLRGKQDGAVCGAVFGLVFDMIIGRMIGVNALFFMYMGYGVGILKERYISAGGAVAFSVTVFAAVAVCGIVYYIAYSMVWGDMRFFAALMRIVLPEALYTAAAALVFFKPVRKSFGLISKKRELI